MKVRATYHAVNQARARHPETFGRDAADKVEDEVRAAIRNGRTGYHVDGYRLDSRHRAKPGRVYLAWTKHRERVYVVRTTCSRRKIVVTILPARTVDRADTATGETA